MTPPRRWLSGALAAGIILAALNLRPALAGISPLLTQIMADLRLTPTAGGMITTAMVMCLGIAAPLAAVSARRLGLARTVLVGLAVLAAGTILRSAGGTIELYLGAAAAGCAIAILNVIMPALVRRHFPDRIGIVTAAYVTALVLGAALAAGLTVPLGEAIDAGWRPAAAAAAPLTVLTFLYWLPLAGERAGPNAARSPLRALLREKVTWYVTGFMGLQSLTFYTALAWLPAMLADAGMSTEDGGYVLGLANLAQIATALTVPVAAARATVQSWYVAAAALATAAGYLGIFLLPTSATWLWAVLLGLGQGASIALALLLITLRAADAPTATALSSVAQSLGYVLAATGPVLIGVLHQLSSGWSLPLAVIVLLLAGQFAVGWLAGQPRQIRSSDT